MPKECPECGYKMSTVVNCPSCNAEVPVPFEASDIDKVENKTHRNYETNCAECGNVVGISHSA